MICLFACKCIDFSILKKPIYLKNKPSKFNEKLEEQNPAAYLLSLSRTKINLALLYTDHIVLREKSIFFAEEAIKDASPFVETVPLAMQLVEMAQEILAYWKDKE
ncbi:MAG: hypothetical protein WDA08_09530 [Weeksellaceae bacterium]